MPLYEQLQSAGSDRERRTITRAVIDDMRHNPEDTTAHIEYFMLCETVIRQLGHTAAHMSNRYGGEFPPIASAALVMTRPRVSGFLQAINRIPDVHSAIEAGPGASAIFSVGAAAHGAEVLALEVNEQAAACAQEVVRLTGYADQITVAHANALTADIPTADIAIAEILGPGLKGEIGPAVVAALARYVRHVIPDAAKLYATDEHPSAFTHHEPWQHVADVDLTVPTKRVSGTFASVGTGQRRVKVRSDIWSQGQPIVAGLGTDDLTAPIAVGRIINIPRAGVPIEFAYDIGAMPWAPDFVAVIKA